jgi:glycosyltransferase involved in cell wall biosynthesis
MAVYNGERFLREAVESVLAQTFTDLELVVVDDGSVDSTPQLLAGYAARDPRLVVHRQPNQGLAVALNNGVRLARAPFIARLDADDVATPDRLHLQREFLIGHEAAAVVGGAAAFVDEDGRSFAEWRYPLTDSEIRTALQYTTPLVHSAVMLRKRAFELVGGYRPLFMSVLDLDLWFRMAEQHELANLPDCVVRYRIHARQMTVQGLERGALENVAARTAARARMDGRPDPLDALERLDYKTLIGMGVTPEEITSSLVHRATWLAKTTGRAGYANLAEELFAFAGDSARSDSGSQELVTHVHRERARRYAEERRRLRATLETVRAILAGRQSRTRNRSDQQRAAM